MLFSVIIPTYQNEKKIEKSIESVLKSGLQDLEIVVVDDGSTDGTGDVVRVLSNKNEQIKYYYKKNSGVSETRNYGIMKARGEYILFLDADDELLPFDVCKIETYANQKVDIIMFGMKFVYNWRKFEVKNEVMSCKRIYDMNYEEMTENFYDLYNENYFTPVWNKFIKRKLIIDNKLFFEVQLTNYEDLEFSLRVLEKSQRIVAIPDVHYNYYNAYGKDRTSNRISKIEDIIGNTDLIAKTFFELDNGLFLGKQKHIQGLYSIVLRVYLEIFGWKMQTTKFSNIKKYCQQFRENPFVNKSLDLATEMSERERRMIMWILEGNDKAIWIYSHYIMVRHEIANRLKLIIFLIRRRKNNE